MALLNPLFRAFGMSGSEDIENARKERAAMEASQDPADRFAMALANRVKDMGQGGASRVLHEMGHGEWPSDPDLRWRTAAIAAKGVADRALSTPLQNMDGGLSRATATRAIEDVTRAVSRPGAVNGVNGLISDTTAETRRQVLAFMSYGKAAEQNAMGQTTALLARPDPAAEERLAADVAEFSQRGTGDRANWLLQAHRTRLAMAQSGLLSADRTVDAAMEAARIAPQAEGALAPYDRARAGVTDPQRRRAILETMQERTRTSAYGAAGAFPGIAPEASAVAQGVEQRQLTQAEQRRHASELMRAQLAESQAVDNPQAVLTAGQPGSGKSYIVKTVGVRFEGHGGVVRIDPDAIRPTIPYMKERIERGDLDIPDAAYADAGTIAYEMIQIAKLERRNLIIDGTLQNTGRATDLANELKVSRYGVEFQGMAIPPDLSHARTYSRRELEIKDSASGFGRGVGDEFHDQAVKGYGITVESFQKKASVDSMTLHFGDGSKPLTTRLVDGLWVPAVSMKDELDNAQRNPSPTLLKEAESTWSRALSLMQKRSAPAEEIAKVEAFKDASTERASKSPGVDPQRSARIQAMRALGDRDI